jgi:hypothetical protein
MSDSPGARVSTEPALAEAQAHQPYTNPISKLAIIALLISGLVGGFLNQVGRLDNTPFLSFSRIFVGLVVGTILLLVLRSVLNRFQAQPLNNVIAFSGVFATALISTAAAILLATNPISNDETFLDYAVVPPAFIIPLLILAMQWTVKSGTLTHLERELRVRQSDLLRGQQDAEERLRDVRSQLEVEVHTALDGPLEAINRELGEVAHQDSDRIATMTQSLVDTAVSIVRPLSHRLAEGTLIAPAQGPLPEVGSEPEDHPPGLVDVVASITPIAATVLAAVSAITGAILSQLPVGQLAVRIATALLIWPLAVVVGRVWPRNLRLLRPEIAVSVLILVYVALLTAVRELFHLLMIVFNQPYLLSKSTPVFFFVAFSFSILLALLGVAQQRQRETLDRLAMTNESMALHNAQLRREIWFLIRKYSWFLHGPVQSALLSSAILLAKRPVESNDVSRVRKTLTSTIEQLRNDPIRIPRIRQALKESESLWSPECQIYVDLSVEFERVLNSNPSAALAAAEICREAISNAIRHGQATQVSIAFEFLSPDELTLVITNNGRPFDAGSTPGLGTVDLDELSRTWSRYNDDRGGPTLIATLPIRDVDQARIDFEAPDEQGNSGLLE